MKANFLNLATILVVASSPGIAGVKAEYSGVELARMEQIRKQELQADVNEAIARSNTEEESMVAEARVLTAQADAEDAEEAEETEAAQVEKTQAPPASPYTIQNNINVGYGAPSAPVASVPAPTPAPVQLAMVETTSTLEGSAAPESTKPGLSITPMVGTLGYVGRWNQHVDNRYAFGLALEQPIGEKVSLELEGDYARSYISYSSFGHYFNRFGLAGNGKLYLMRGVFNPYVGAGLQANLYQNMSQGPSFPANYNHWLGSGQLLAGGDVQVADGVMVGVRGAYSHPLINKPITLHNQVQSFPRYEESAAINTAFYRLMGAVKVNL